LKPGQASTQGAKIGSSARGGHPQPPVSHERVAGGGDVGATLPGLHLPAQGGAFGPAGERFGGEDLEQALLPAVEQQAAGVEGHREQVGRSRRTVGGAGGQLGHEIANTRGPRRGLVAAVAQFPESLASKLALVAAPEGGSGLGVDHRDLRAGQEPPPAAVAKGPGHRLAAVVTKPVGQLAGDGPGQPAFAIGDEKIQRGDAHLVRNRDRFVHGRGGLQVHQPEVGGRGIVHRPFEREGPLAGRLTDDRTPHGPAGGDDLVGLSLDLDALRAHLELAGAGAFAVELVRQHGIGLDQHEITGVGVAVGESPTRSNRCSPPPRPDRRAG
jgi:hypothetical protein